MSTPGLHPLGSGLFVFLSLLSPIFATTATNWTNPDAHQPDFSSTYLVGERILLSWQPLNQSNNDLWLTRYDVSNNYTLRIATSLNIAGAGSFPWTIAVSEEEVKQDTRFAFVFVPAGSGYDAAAPSDLESPAFNLKMVNQATPPNGTVSANPTNLTSSTAQSSSASLTSATSTSDPSSTSPPASDDTASLSTGKITAIIVGVLVAVGLACFAAGFLFYKKRKSPHAQNSSADLDVPMTGPYEVLGSSKSPTELNSKEIQVHELVSSQETLAHESDSTPVHEVGNTVKRPGLYEMPG